MLKALLNHHGMKIFINIILSLQISSLVGEGLILPLQALKEEDNAKNKRETMWQQKPYD